MPVAFNPGDFEDDIYNMWMAGGFFMPVHSRSSGPASTEVSPQGSSADPTEASTRWSPGDPPPVGTQNRHQSFVIPIPPPNVTGVLHMGHGLNISLQDILIRYWRMKGRPTLWITGTDHAGIATQNVVEKRLDRRGIDKNTLGREEFIRETWAVKKEHHGVIQHQLKKLGASCDWSRERFTLDEGCSRAVNKVFVSLYNKGLIYRDEYLVNWCSSCGTALADDEVAHQEKQGGLWEIRYRIPRQNKGICVATTRPETIFADSAIAVHPDDERYRALIGGKALIPIIEREIPIIADPYVEKDFGTGALKITPAHDINDYEIGRKHGLSAITIIDRKGRMNEESPPLVQGQTVNEARKTVAGQLEKEGSLVSFREHPHQVGHCYRCSHVIEPHLSEQWFVRMHPMAQKALKAWEEGQLRFYPRKWENTYRYWLENVRDWCISRQIWWGHRIPAWTCSSCGEFLVLEESPRSCPHCGEEKLVQDPDVLDTWFSSWLWPFSTLGWPEDTEDLRLYYPASALVTGYDIIFFWVARMVMAGLEFTGTVPFRDIYITGLIRDKKGRKMSKSLGNGIDPLELVEQYGADAVKFTLAYLSAQGEDIPFGKDTPGIGSKFANKIWNAARFILMNQGTSGDNAPGTIHIPEARALPRRWIIHRLSLAIRQLEAAFTTYRFDDMAHIVYEYFWNDFCDWFLECCKPEIYSTNPETRRHIFAVILQIFENSLKILHPFLPFITEEIWTRLPGSRKPLIITDFPSAAPLDSDAQADFAMLQAITTTIRTARSEFNIPPSRFITIRVYTDAPLDKAALYIETLCRSDNFAFLPEDIKPWPQAISVPGSGFTVHLKIREFIDMQKVKAGFRKSLAGTERLIENKKRKLANKNFISKAPDAIIKRESEALKELLDRKERTAQYLKELNLS